MGRFDALTTLDTKPAQPAPLPEKSAPIPSRTPSEVQFASKPASPQTGLLVNQQTRKPASMQTRLHANQQTSKDTSSQTGKPASMQVDKPASMQAGKQVTLQTGKQVFIKKYSSYLPHEYKRELKRIAFESDRKEYEVLLEAVEQYLTRHKQSK